MTDSILWKRRQFLGRGLAGLGTLLLSGCYDLSQKPWFTGILGEVENLTHSAQHLFAGPHTLAPEYAKSDIAPVFRANGTLDPGTPDYKAHAASGFRHWRVTVSGLVERPVSLTMDDIRKLRQRTQITRHDCVEGWSCIGEWSGPQLALILAAARPKPNARYAVFYCADPMTAEGDPDHKYYETGPRTWIWRRQSAHRRHRDSCLSGAARAAEETFARRRN